MEQVRRWVDALLERLRAQATKERAEKERAYLKSDLKHLGATMPQIRSALKKVFPKRVPLPRELLLEFAEYAWTQRIFELRMCAVDLLCQRSAVLRLGDAKALEVYLREARTWALLDPLAIRVVGDLTVRFRGMAKWLDRWSKDEDFWLRRAAMLALLRPLRAGEGDFERFSRYADGMLEEREFFIRKAIGWILRERSKCCPDEVHQWLAARTQRTSGLTLREGSKHLPEEQRVALLSAYKNGVCASA